MTEPSENNTQPERLERVHRFFVELNEPITVKGLNLAGFLPGLLLSGIPLGLGMFSWMFGIVFLSLALARRMVHQPKLIAQLATRLKARSWTIPSGEDCSESLFVYLPSGQAVSLTEWAALRSAAARGDESAALALN